MKILFDKKKVNIRQNWSKVLRLMYAAMPNQHSQSYPEWLNEQYQIRYILDDSTFGIIGIELPPSSVTMLSIKYGVEL